MKVCFVVDYLPVPFSDSLFSGAEVSIDLLFKALKENGVTINYASYADHFRIDKNKNLPDAFWLNPLIIIFGAFKLAWLFLQQRPGIIHLHGKNSLYSAYLANMFFRLPIVITVRDYKLLCNLGACLLYGDKACSLHEYVVGDIPTYARKYSKNFVVTTIKLFLLLPVELVRRIVTKRLLCSMDKVICISKAQEKIYKKYGLKNTTTVYNLITLANLREKPQVKEKTIIYTGRRSPGKGVEILNFVIKEFSRRVDNWRIITIGDSGVENDVKSVTHYGQVPVDKYREIVSHASLAIVPSQWPEPFGRSALDALSVGTPVVATNRGGLPEIIDDQVTGIITNPDPKSFFNGLLDGINKAHKLQENIFKTRTKFIEKFYNIPLEKHISLYREILS